MILKGDEILRLDQFLSKKLQISRNQASKLIKDSLVSINNKIITKNSYMVEIDDEISINFIQKPNELEFQTPNFDIEILYEDEDILVINKPSGVVIHTAPSVKEPTLVDWLLSKNFTLSSINGDIRPGIVHRLDKGTSGAMIVAKNNKSHNFLSNQLLDKSMGRIYLMITNLGLKENLIIDKPIGRNPQNRLKMDIISGGRSAKTAFSQLYDNDKFHLLCAKLFTGRTHQIRVHLKDINRMIIGDELYGFKDDLIKFNRIMLHSYLLYFTHPKTKEFMMIKSTLPDEFYKFFNKDFDDEIINENRLFHLFDDCNSWLCRS